MRNFGLVVTFFGLMLLMNAYFDLPSLVSALFGSLFALVMLFMTRSPGHPHVADAETRLAHDQRSPVVLLRARGAVHPPRLGWVTLALSEAGPMVALQWQKKEVLPAGVSPYVVRDEADAQHKMEQWLAEASLVLLDASTAVHFGTDLRRLLGRVAPERLVMAVTQSSWDKVRAELDPLLSHPLPDEMGRSGLVTFDSDLRPTFLPDLTSSAQRSNSMGREHVLWIRNLHPVFEELGITINLEPAYSTPFKVIAGLGLASIAIVMLMIVSMG